MTKRRVSITSQTKIDRAKAALCTARELAEEAVVLAIAEADAANAAAALFAQQASDAKKRQIEAESLV